MKNLRNYILESLSGSQKQFFDNTLKSQKSLIVNNKVTQIDIDISKIGQPQILPLDNLDLSYKNLKELITDKQVGFTTLSNFIMHPNRYLIDQKDKNKQLKMKWLPYFYSEDAKDPNKPNYMISNIVFDDSAQYVDNMMHIMNIESAIPVQNQADVNKQVFTLFINQFVKLKYKDIVGFTAKPSDMNIKGTLTRLGFKTMADNNEILTYKI